MWKDVKKAFPDPNCPACREGAKRAGMLPTYCPVCGADRSAENWQEDKKGGEQMSVATQKEV